MIGLRNILLSLLLLTGMCAVAQEHRTISLDEAIAIARVRSVDAAVALDELRQAYWEYRTYRAELLPEVSFNATLPSYYKQYTPYMDSEGSYSFVRTNYLEMTGELSLTQNVWLTGGTLSLTTSLDFLRQLEGAKYNRYMSVPIALTLNQPLFAVNTVKWDRKIEPVRYQEAKAEFLSETEEVAMLAINYYFNLLMALETLDISQQNLDNANKLYDVAVEKRKIGQISKNDLLQMELNQLNARSEMTSAESNYKSQMFRLRSFLGIDEDVELIPEVPAVPPHFDVVFADALDRALSNNSFVHNIHRRQLEADYEVAKAMGAFHEVSLYAQVGYTGMDADIGRAYNPLKDNQIVEVGISIPLIDWGKRKGQVKVAQNQRQVVENEIRKETRDFSQDLFILVERFNNQQQQVELAKRSDEISQQRYATNVETYLIGRLSTLDLNDSQVSKDEARQAYVNQLYYYWYYLYQLRSLTLWDYINNCGIDADIERIIKG